MAKTTDYTALTGAGTATNDVIIVADVSAAQTKKQTYAELWLALSGQNVQAAYTQTYSTAARTVPNATVAAVATTASTQTTPWGYGSQAQADAVPVAINALAADVLALKKVITALIDDLQALGLAT